MLKLKYKIHLFNKVFLKITIYLLVKADFSLKLYQDLNIFFSKSIKNSILNMYIF